MKKIITLLGLVFVAILLYGVMLLTDYQSPLFPVVIWGHAGMVWLLGRSGFKTFNVGFLIFGGIILLCIAITINNPPLLCLVILDLLYTVVSLIHKDNYEDNYAVHRQVITRKRH